MTYSELLAQIKKIQEKLWNTSPFGNVSIIIGSGFSKNAIPTDGSPNTFPDWTELASNFLDALYPDDDDNSRSKRIVKSEVPSYISRLAQEYIELFSQKDLNDLIEESIPDSHYTPGKVHEELLKLPFKDIFTTNYDTLLERTAIKNYEREYKVITTKEQLSGSSSPRIIKLHGSFPNVTPYIISEEHYRKYPTEYKPFVNTVIQSLIENTLLLIGFSGDDPNFLKWIGWIRDELPDIRQKVYICTVSQKDEFNEAQKRLLARRGVELLDLRIALDNDEILQKSNNKFNDALLWLFSKLKDGEKKESPRRWPYNHLEHLPGSTLEPQKITKTQLESSFISYLETIRITFPGWNIVPSSNRISLNSYIIEEYAQRFKDFSSIINDIENYNSLIENYFWIKRILLESISITTSNYFRSYFTKDIIESIDSQSSICKTSLFNNLVHMYIDARENLEITDMKKYETALNQIEGFSKQQKDWFIREKALFILKTGNYKKLKELLLNWDLSEEVLSVDLLFKVSFLMEIGADEDSKRILYKLLGLIRTAQKKDITLKSMEGICIYLLQRFEDRFARQTDSESEDFEDRMLQLEYDQCNPQTHIRDLQSTISEKKKISSGSVRIKKFDPFSYTQSVSLGAGLDLSNENRFINLFDYTPIPLRTNLYVAVNDKVITRLAMNTIYTQPLNIIPVLIRYRSTKVLDDVINRLSIFAMTDENFEVLKNIYVESYCEIFDSFLKTSIEERKKADLLIVETLQKLISFMIPRLESNTLNKIMQRALKVFTHPQKTQYQLSNNATAIINRICSQKRFFCEENLNSIITFFNLPLPEQDFTNNPRIDVPHISIPYTKFLDGLRDNISINSSLIQDLLSVSKDPEHPANAIAILRLATFLEYGLLGEEIKIQFNDILWSQITVDKVFNFNKLRSWVPFKYVPDNRKKDLDCILSAFKQKLQSIDFSSHLKPPHSIGGLTELQIIINDLLNISESFDNEYEFKKVKWSSEEAKHILKSIIDSWDSIKADILNMKSSGGSFGIQTLSEQYNNLFHYCNLCIFPCLEEYVLDNSICIEMYETLGNVGIYIPEILIWNFESNKELLLTCLSSINKTEQSNTIKAIIYGIGSGSIKEQYCDALLDELVGIIQNRRQPGLFKSLDLVRFLYVKSNDLFSEEMVNKIIIGLDKVEKETKFPTDLSLLNEEWINGISPIEFSDYRALLSMFIKALSKRELFSNDQTNNVNRIKTILQTDRYPEVRLPFELSL